MAEPDCGTSLQVSDYADTCFGLAGCSIHGPGALELESGILLVAGVANHPDQGMNDTWLHVVDEKGDSTVDHRFGGRTAERPGSLPHQGMGPPSSSGAAS